MISIAAKSIATVDPLSFVRSGRCINSYGGMIPSVASAMAIVQPYLS